jgi:hypothetical protein
LSPLEGSLFFGADGTLERECPESTHTHGITQGSRAGLVERQLSPHPCRVALAGVATETQRPHGYLILDSDLHMMEPDDLWARYL